MRSHPRLSITYCHETCTDHWEPKTNKHQKQSDEICLADACTPSTKKIAAASGKAILATRGDCSFIEKAEAMAAGPSGRVGALIVTNSETSLFHMGAGQR